MFDIGWSELCLSSRSSADRIGPKDLPCVLSMVGPMDGQARKMALNSGARVQEAMREAKWRPSKSF